MPILVAQLLQNGLGILGNALLAKGKEVVEDKLGVKLNMDKEVSQEELFKLRELQFKHEETLLELAIKKEEIQIEAEKAASKEVSSRWDSDMKSDSWLSKNIRPLVLIYLLTTYTVLSTASAFGLEVKQIYIELLASWSQLVMSAYFVGRTIEKFVSIKKGE